MDDTGKRYQVVISDAAAEMLVSHIHFLAQVSEQAAENLREHIINKIRNLESSPQIYSWFSGDFIPANKYRKIIVDKRYLIIFQIRDETVFVDYILDCRQNYGWLLK